MGAVGREGEGRGGGSEGEEEGSSSKGVGGWVKEGRSSRVEGRGVEEERSSKVEGRGVGGWMVDLKRCRHQLAQALLWAQRVGSG